MRRVLSDRRPWLCRNRARLRSGPATGSRSPGLSPNRLQDRQNGLRVDRINGLLPNRAAIFCHGLAPLARVLLASPFAALRFDQLIRALPERLAGCLSVPGGLLCVQGSSPLASIERYSAAFSRASARVTIDAEPKPASRCFPASANMNVQRFDSPLSVFEMVRYSCPVRMPAYFCEGGHGPGCQSFKLPRHLRAPIMS